ncbi:MFS transporter [Bordetella genomosp. 9]|uniref:MFS transporter n=1 Tax=Bordetella genomosp. 9 TaxID=1416803 RepID=A0A1W6Z445_9BORD|nr:MFS transporter [Bordetella genomosp. 9]ARP87869.1 MFS transporter [Bordetella genomosp. 9]
MQHPSPGNASIEKDTMRRVMTRVVPLLIVCYIISYLDRVNVGFAALTMNKDLGFSAAVYGLGAGIFFLTYFIFELPSNLMLHRFGARRWIARILFTWGVLSGAMGFIPQLSAMTGLSYEAVFYTLRLLLGAAEAGFFPGIIYYLTLWFPAAYRARVIGYFMTALPLASVIGAPLSGWLLGMGSADGFAGWQWMFVIEAIPAVLLAGVVLRCLTDLPGQAGWLTPEQRGWLTRTLTDEAAQQADRPRMNVLRTLTHPMVLLLGLVYFSVVYMNYTLGFFLPTIIRDFGLTPLQTGMLAAIPAAVGALSMVFWGRRSDRKGERKWHLVFALGVGGVSFALAALGSNPALIMVCFSIAAFGIYGSQPVFWTMPGTFLTGGAAAAGIAIINSLANLSGFMGPSIMGWVKDATGSYTSGLLLAAGMAILATVVVASFGVQRFQVARQ